MDIKIEAFHEIYGDGVRHGPNELSFISEAAWQDIYGRVSSKARQGKFQLPKITTRDEIDGPESIINASDANHARMRKLLWPGFSEQGIRGRGAIVNRSLGFLTERFDHAVEHGEPIDIGDVLDEWNADFLEDFAFSGDGTKVGKQMRVEVNTVYQWHYQTPFLRMAEDFPILASIAGFFRPIEWKSCRARVVSHAKNVVMSRLSSTDHPPDLLSLALSDDKSLNKIPEAVGNAAVMIIAGSDAASTAMTGTLYWIFRTPHVLNRVRQELRMAFSSEEEISISVLPSKTPYLMACIGEGLRLYPPAPGIFYRIVPDGPPIEISGHTVQSKVSSFHPASPTKDAT